MSERDSLREKMHLKERAEEDQYFAARDRELLAKLKNQQEAEREKTYRELALSRCPECGDRLYAYPILGGVIHECRRGHGAWLSQAQIVRVAQQHEKGWTARFLTEFLHLLEHPRT